MLHSLIITLTPWLPTHTAPMDIVSVSVTSCMPPKCVRPHSLMHTHAHTHIHTHIMDGRENAERVILSAITAGLLEEWTPITANQTEPNTASVHQPPLHPAAATPDTPFSLPGSVAFPLVIAVRWPAMCYKWDKLQRLGDVRVGGCEWVAMAANSQGIKEREARLWVWEENGYNFWHVRACLCFCLYTYVHFGLACENRHLTENMTAEETPGALTLPIEKKESNAKPRASRLACTSSAHQLCLFIHKVSFIPVVPAHLAGGGGENNSRCCAVLCSTASPCLGSTWRICRRTGPPYWPGTDWHMSGEGGVRKRGGEVTEPLVSVI